MNGLILFFFLVILWVIRAASKGSSMGNNPAAGKNWPGAKISGKQRASKQTAGESGSLPITSSEEVPRRGRDRELLSGSLGVESAEGKDPCHDAYQTMASGSLGGETPEGRDPCHDDWKPAVPAAAASAETAEPGGMNLSWTGSDIVKGFVYGEILKRKVS